MLRPPTPAEIAGLLELTEAASQALAVSPYPRIRIFDYGSGALTCREAIPGITQQLDEDSAGFYGGQHFVAESMSRIADRALALGLGGVLADEIVHYARQAGVALLALPPGGEP